MRLLLPYISLILLLTIAIGGFTYWAGARTVSTLTERMLQEMVNRIAQSVVHHVSGSGAILEAVFPQGMPAPQNIEDDWNGLRNRLWAATTLHPHTNDYVYYGNLQGQGVGIKRLADASAELRLKTSAHEHRKYYRLHHIDGEKTYLETEEKLFDPRTRPWFLQAQAAHSHTWTSVYIDFSAQDLVVTRARRVLDLQGNFQGVVGTDVSLLALNRFVNELGHSVQGRAFIMEPNGDLVAASGIENVQKNAAGQMERVSVYSVNDALIEGVYKHIRPFFHQHTPSDDLPYPSKTKLMKDSDGNELLVAYRHVLDEAGIDWMAVVAVPRATMLEDVSSIVEVVTLAGALATALALIMGMRVFGRVADDVHQLSHAVQQIGQGIVTTPIETSRQDEIGTLARSFHHMRQELFTDRLTGVSNRTALQHTMSALIECPNGEAQPFAVLFLDLDYFKPINDRWGHKNGDRALIEIAQRIRSNIRESDYVARWGGDEFVIILKDVISHLDAQTTAQSLMQVLCLPLQHLQDVPEGEVISLGASVGIALYPQDGRDIQTLLHHADQDMYRTKSERHLITAGTAK